MASDKRDDILALLTDFEKEMLKTKSLATLAQKLVEDVRVVITDVTIDAEIINIKDNLARPRMKWIGLLKN